MKYSLVDLRLIDAPPEPAFDNLTNLAASLLNAPVALISFIDLRSDKQYFKSQHGLSGPCAEKTQAPLSHSICKDVVNNDVTLIIEDKSKHPTYRDTPSIHAANIQAYLGTPIKSPQGNNIGSICAIDTKPRKWSTEQVHNLECLAKCVADAIKLKASTLDSEALRMEQAEFTYAISHDLKSPVNTLNLLINALSENAQVTNGLKPETYLSQSLHTIEHMSKLIEDILDYTRVCADTKKSDTKASLNPIVQNIIENMSPELNKCNASITVSCLPSLYANPMHLRIIFQNLLSNALKFRRENVPLNVSISIEQDPKSQLCVILVCDNGIGIEPKYQHKIFKVFSRLHTQSDYPGTGLGLALCHRIVSLYDGEITVKSNNECGTCFRISFPDNLL